MKLIYNSMKAMENAMKSGGTRSTAVNHGIDFLRKNNVVFAPVLIELLAEGEAVSLEELAAKGGWSIEKLRQDLAEHPSVEYDDNGHIAGFGLTLRPTPHRFDFKGQTVYGWCASDALFFPLLLRKSGVVSSVCPVTKKEIRIKVTPDRVLAVDPPEAVVSSVRPDEKVNDIRKDICSVGLFFSSHEVAKDWLATHPDGFLHSVEEDFEVHRQVFAELEWIK